MCAFDAERIEFVCVYHILEALSRSGRIIHHSRHCTEMPRFRAFHVRNIDGRTSSEYNVDAAAFSVRALALSYIRHSLFSRLDFYIFYLLMMVERQHRGQVLTVI